MSSQEGGDPMQWKCPPSLRRGRQLPGTARGVKPGPRLPLDVLQLSDMCRVASSARLFCSCFCGDSDSGGWGWACVRPWRAGVGSRQRRVPWCAPLKPFPNWLLSFCSNVSLFQFFLYHKLPSCVERFAFQIPALSTAEQRGTFPEEMLEHPACFHCNPYGYFSM